MRLVQMKSEDCSGWRSPQWLLMQASHWCISIWSPSAKYSLGCFWSDYTTMALMSLSYLSLQCFNAFLWGWMRGSHMVIGLGYVGDGLLPSSVWTVQATWEQVLLCNVLTLFVSMSGFFLLIVIGRSWRVPQKWCALLMMSGSFNAGCITVHWCWGKQSSLGSFCTRNCGI